MDEKEANREGLKVPLTLVANWLLGPVLIWGCLAILITAPFPIYTGEGTLLHWANFALGGSLLFYLLKGPRFGAVVILYWLLAVWLITFYGPYWPRWQFWLALWGLAWGGQILRRAVAGKTLGPLREVSFILIGLIWAVRLIYKRLGANY